MLLAYDDCGPGPVVVLLHGFPLSRAMWKGQETEVGSFYRVIAPDLRGHGETAAPEGVYTMDAMADDLIETLDALQVREPAVLGGLSMGGYVALSAALRYPDRFRGLMLMDTRASADSHESAMNREGMANEVDSSGTTDAVVAGMLAKVFSPITRETRAHLIDFAHGLMIKTPARAVAGSLRGMARRPDRTKDLARAQPAHIGSRRRRRRHHPPGRGQGHGRRPAERPARSHSGRRTPRPAGESRRE